MTRVVKVPMKPVPPDATDAERLALYEDYKRRLLAANPHLTNGFWRWLWRTLKL